MISSFPTKKPYNQGGYTSFKFVPAYFVAAFPLVANGVTSAAVTLKDGFDWLTGYATMETLSFNQDGQMDVSGMVQVTTVTGFVPGDKPELTALIFLMMKQRFILLIKDSQGQQRLIGTPGAPLEFTAVFDSGKLRSDAKGYNFTFSGTSIKPSPVYTVV